MGTCIRCRKHVDDTPFCPWCGTKQEKKQKVVKARANGTGTAYKRGKTWTASITLRYYTDENGKNHRINKTKGGFKTKTAALEYCQQLKNEHTNKSAPMLLDYWMTYENAEYKKLSKSKQNAYSKAWERLKPLHSLPVDLITVSNLREVVQRECETYYPARDMKILLSHLFKLAGADGFVTKDLPSYIELPKLEEKERQPFTDQEQQLLWRYYDSGGKDAALPLIMIATGMMPGEMQKLRVEMVDLENRKITGAGMKTNIRKKLSIILPDDICPVFEDVIDGRKSGLVFPMYIQKFYEQYYSALECAGITRHLTPYSCRHTTATRHTIDEHTPAQVVARLMRWSSTRMMDRYVHVSDDEAKYAANAIKRKSPCD